MRKKGIIILLVIIALFAVIAFFARDRYFERALESAGQAIAGAKVEIDDFRFSLFKMECSWNQLQVVDKNNPWYNILETGRASFDIEVRPLFWKRVIIREMALENVRSNTKRTTDGSIPKKPEKKDKKTGAVVKAKEQLRNELEKMPAFDLSGLGKKLKIDSLVDVDNLISVQEYKKVNQMADSSFDYWKKQTSPTDYEARLNKLEQDIKALKIDEIKDVASLTAALTKLKKIQQEIKSLREKISDQYADLRTTFDDLEQKLKQAQDSVQQDIDRAKSLAKIKDLDVKDVSMLLFGEPVVSRIEQVFGYVETAREYIPKAKKMASANKKEKKPRMQGRNVLFPFHYRYPRFLMRTANFSAATAAGDTSRAYFVEGVLKGVTNEPAIYNRPTRFNFDLKKIDGNAYNMKGSFDHITAQAKDSLWISARNFGLGKVNLKKSRYFPEAVTAQKGDISLTGYFIEDAIDMKLKFDAKPVNFIYADAAAGRIEAVIRDVLKGLKELKLNASVQGEKSDYQLRMNSNVDRLLANQVKNTIQKNLRDAQMQVENYVREQSNKYRTKAETVIAQNREKLLNQMETLKQRAQEQTDKIEQKRKEVEERIEKEKTKVGDEAKKKLKDILKTP